MTRENRRDGIAKELRHAESAREAARLLADAAMYNDALNRIYYALFHTLVALLLTEGVEPKRHRGMPHLLGSHFPSLLSAADIALVSRIATYRDLADYERTWEATADIFLEAACEIDPLIRRVRDHLSTNEWI